MISDIGKLAEAILESFSIEEEIWQDYALRKTVEYSIDKSSYVHIDVFRKEIKL